MARLPRLYVPGCSHHIIQRGNNRDACFFDEKDYAFYFGRWTLKAGYIESIGSTMWLGEHFWNYVGRDKKQHLIEESWIRTEVLENGVVKLIAADECFMDESTADKQNCLREILYGS